MVIILMMHPLERCARSSRRDHGLLQVMRLDQKPGHQCLSWSTGDVSMMPPNTFPRAHTCKYLPMIARYPLESWKRDGHAYLTEKDWRHMAYPICTSNTDSEEWLRAITDDTRGTRWGWMRWSMCEKSRSITLHPCRPDLQDADRPLNRRARHVGGGGFWPLQTFTSTRLWQQS